MRKAILITLCLAFTATILGCGTIKGLGEDVSALGGWLTRGSANVQENLDGAQ